MNISTNTPRRPRFSESVLPPPTAMTMSSTKTHRTNRIVPSRSRWQLNLAVLSGVNKGMETTRSSGPVYLGSSELPCLDEYWFQLGKDPSIRGRHGSIKKDEGHWILKPEAAGKLIQTSSSGGQEWVEVSDAGIVLEKDMQIRLGHTTLLVSILDEYHERELEAANRKNQRELDAANQKHQRELEEGNQKNQRELAAANKNIGALQDKLSVLSENHKREMFRMRTIIAVLVYLFALWVRR